MINEKVMEWDTKFGQNLKNMFDDMMGNPIEKIDELIEGTGMEVKEVEGLSGRESELANLEAEHQGEIVDEGDYDGSREMALDELQADYFNAHR